MQHVIHVVQVFQHRRQHQKTHHDFHAGQPLTGAGQFLQPCRKQREQEKREGKAAGEGGHSGYRAKLIARYGGRQQCSHKRPDTGEGGEGKGQSHQEGADKAALPGGLVQFRKDAGRDGDLESAQQAQAKHEKDNRDKAVHPDTGAHVVHARGAEKNRGQQTESGKQNHDAEAKRKSLRESAFLSHEIRHRNGNHREDAGCKNRGETDAERQD